jgi:Zn ribbon nucleic-acid-binding protein
MYFPAPSDLPLYAMNGLEEVNERGAKEITRVVDWMRNQSKLHEEVLETRKKQMVSGDHLTLIAGRPESKPFWTDNNIDLECFACGFSQRRNDSFNYLEIPWMTKRIRKSVGKNDDEQLTIAFCPSCMSGEPWVVHNADNYTMIHVAKESKNKHEPLVSAITRDKTSKDWLERPIEPSHIRRYWTSSDFMERPYDWEEQEDKFTAQMEKYKSEKVLYDTFCVENIAKIPSVKTQTTREAIQRIDRARVDAFRAKCDNPMGFRSPVSSPKKLPPAKKIRQIAPFNSPVLAAHNDNKENLFSNP